MEARKASLCLAFLIEKKFVNSLHFVNTDTRNERKIMSAKKAEMLIQTTRCHHERLQQLPHDNILCGKARQGQFSFWQYLLIHLALSCVTGQEKSSGLFDPSWTHTFFKTPDGPPWYPASSARVSMPQSNSRQNDTLGAIFNRNISSPFQAGEDWTVHLFIIYILILHAPRTFFLVLSAVPFVYCTYCRCLVFVAHHFPLQYLNLQL